MGSLQNRISRTANGVLAKRFRSGRRILKNAARSTRLYGVLLCFVMVFSLILTVGQSALVLAYTHTGEQTAQFMTSDIDGYATVNLNPGVEQGLKFKDLMDNWWNYAGTQGTMQELMGQINDASGIDIQNDVLPWLGPEIAAGVRGPGFVIANQTPEFVVFVGTTDNVASYNFFFDKFLPLAMGTDITPPTGPNGDYWGIDTLTIPEDSRYCAFVDEYIADKYIIVSSSSSLFYECLDLIRGAGGSSLADTAGFQAAQASLPKPSSGGVEEERAAMIYFNAGAVWQQLAAQAEPGTPEDFAVEFFTPYIPDFAAISASFVDKGIKLDFYSPTPAGLDVPSLTPTPLNAADIIPGDAAGMYSINDINGIWQAMSSFATKNWVDIGIMTGIGADWPESLTALLGQVESDYGINVDEDIFSWMNGECTVVQMPWGTGPTGPETLLFLQVDDQALVQGKIETIISAINDDMVKYAQPGDTVDPLELKQTLIGDVAATFVTNSAIEASGSSPGYLFLDDFLVIGSSKDALSAVVVTHSHPELSLAQTAEFQRITSSLQVGNAGMLYVNGSRVVDRFLSLMDSYQRSEFEEYAAPFLDPLRSAGLSVSVGQDAIRGSFILHIERTAATLAEGQVHLQGSLEHGGATIAAGSQQAVSNPLGWFSLSGVTAADNVTVTASMPGYLSAQRTGVTIGDGVRDSLGPVTLVGGDVNGDSAIDSSDLTQIGGAFNTAPPALGSADLNGDGIVDTYDLVWIGKNYGKHAPTPWLADVSKGAISGFVRDTGGAPIPDASIAARDYNTGYWVAGSQSESDGSYVLEGLPAGTYRVQAGAYSAYLSEYYYEASNQPGATPVAVSSAQQTGNIDFTLALGGSVSGFVYDANDAPISAAYVQVTDNTIGNWAGSANTGSDGSYKVWGLPTGNYVVRASAYPYVTEYYQEAATREQATPVPVTLSQEASGINFTLALGGSISGFVYDADDAPISGVYVRVTDNTTGNWAGSANTGSDGSYKVRGLPTGNYVVRASAYPYVTEYYQDAATREQATPVPVTVSQETGGIDFTLDPSHGSISGYVTDSQDNPIAGASIEVTDNVTGRGVGCAHTSDDGSYEVVGLPSGNYVVTANAYGYIGEYYQEVSTRQEATLVPLSVGQEIGGINFTLALSP